MRIGMVNLWRRSRHEVWFSIVLTLAATFIFCGHAPLGPRDTIGYPIALLFAFLLALDAVLDWSRAGIWYRIITATWFVLLCYLLPLMLYAGFTTRFWADR